MKQFHVSLLMLSFFMLASVSLQAGNSDAEDSGYFNEKDIAEAEELAAHPLAYLLRGINDRLEVANKFESSKATNRLNVALAKGYDTVTGAVVTGAQTAVDCGKAGCQFALENGYRVASSPRVAALGNATVAVAKPAGAYYASTHYAYITKLIEKISGVMPEKLTHNQVADRVAALAQKAPINVEDVDLVATTGVIGGAWSFVHSLRKFVKRKGFRGVSLRGRWDDMDQEDRVWVASDVSKAFTYSVKEGLKDAGSSAVVVGLSKAVNAIACKYGYEEKLKDCCPEVVRALAFALVHAAVRQSPPVASRLH